eukprot:s330_g21.t5
MAYGGVPATRHRPPAQGVWRSAWWHQMQPLARIRKEGALEETLARVTRHHVAVDPSPDIKDQLVLLHADPAVLLIPGLWSQQACDKLILAALCSGAMRQSSCSGYGIETGEAQAARTSGSVVMKPDLAGRFGAEGLVRKLVRDLTGVLGVGGAPGESAEYPQVVRYERGQRFDLHEDAFAWEQVKQAWDCLLLPGQLPATCHLVGVFERCRPRRGHEGVFSFLTSILKSSHGVAKGCCSFQPSEMVIQMSAQCIQLNRLWMRSGSHRYGWGKEFNTTGYPENQEGSMATGHFDAVAQLAGTLDTQVFLPQHSADMKPEPI